MLDLYLSHALHDVNVVRLMYHLVLKRIPFGESIMRLETGRK